MKITVAVILTAAATWLVSYLSQPVWLEQRDGRVSVVAKLEGKRFSILSFDKSLLDNSSSLTGLDMTDGKKHPGTGTFQIDPVAPLARNL